jgi:ferric enterobactin receptor
MSFQGPDSHSYFIRYFLLLFTGSVLGFSIPLLAQHNGSVLISGTILDSASLQPIEYAAVSVFAAGHAKPLNGSVTDASGSFTIYTKKQPGLHILIESIGYRSVEKGNLLLQNKGARSLGRILLSRNSSILGVVIINAPDKLIDNRIDKMVFNAEKDLTSQGGVATDILKKIPQVSVDVDGNVELSGSSSIRFLIDGKPSTAFGSNIVDVLQSIPASQIKQVEVITNPGAKYDAEGLGGIINIILKHNAVRGVNGNISLTVTSRNENASLNLNARNEGFGINVFVNANTRLTATTPLISARISQDTGSKTNIFLQQNGNSRFRRYGVESGLGLDWTYRKRNIFNFSVNNNFFGSNSNGFANQNQTITDYGGNMLEQTFILSNTQNGFRVHEINASLDYKRILPGDDHEFDLGVHTTHGSNEFNSANQQSDLPSDSLFYGTRNNNPERQNETEMVADYTQPLARDVGLGVGAKLDFRNINSNSNVFSLQPFTGYTPDSVLSNSLYYRQSVFALYSEISFPVKQWFDAKMGLRYERTTLHTIFSNLAQQVSEPGYNTFVPSIFFRRKLGTKSTLKLSYSKRIERPDYRDLNPFINTTDPKNIFAGNPYLKPEIGNRFELAWNHDITDGGSFMITIFYRTSQDDIQPYVVYYASLPVGDTVYTNVAVSTRQNVGLEKNLGFNFFADIHPSPKFSLRTNLFVFHRNIVNALDPGLDAQSWNYRINVNLAYNFSGSLAGELFGNFNSPRNEIQGKYPSFTTYTMALRKQFWKKKGSVAFTMTNPFNEYVAQKTEITGIGFNVNSTRKIPYRSFGLKFTWKFGKLEFKKQKSENQDPGQANPDG